VKRRSVVLLFLGSLCFIHGQNAATEETIQVDASGPSNPFPHIWEQMFGSGRAVLSLRESYRSDLKMVRDITGFQYVRFHAILDDENGVYS
jgi:xylan 1,4-beta-xylosidase